MSPARRGTTFCARWGLLLVAFAALAGCSAKTWYAGLQTSAENECRRLPPGESPSCLARVNTMSYEDYERKRSGRNP